MDENFWNKLCANDIEFISITSNKGTIELPASHPIFEHYFSPQLKKLKLLRREILESQSKGLKFYLVDMPFQKIWRFLNTSELGSYQKKVVTGMFLVYFKLYRGKPVMTKDEWEKSPSSAANYKRYLSETVKNWLENT